MLESVKLARRDLDRTSQYTPTEDLELEITAPRRERERERVLEAIVFATSRIGLGAFWGLGNIVLLRTTGYMVRRWFGVFVFYEGKSHCREIYSYKGFCSTRFHRMIINDPIIYVWCRRNIRKTMPSSVLCKRKYQKRSRSSHDFHQSSSLAS